MARVIGEALLKAKPVAKKVCPPKLSKMAMLCALGFEPKKEDPIL